MLIAAVVLVLVTAGSAAAQAPPAAPSGAQQPRPGGPQTPAAPEAAPAPRAPAAPPSAEERGFAPAVPGTSLSPTVTPTGARVPTRPAPLEAPVGQLGPFTVTPSFRVTEEFNDNVLQSNANRRSDFITGFTPGLSFAVRKEAYRLLVAYELTSELYAKETELNDALARQNLLVDGLWRVAPRLTLTLSNVFTQDNNTNIASIEGFAVGRTSSTSNVLSPGVTWELDQRTTLRGAAAWEAQRFEERGPGSDTDTGRLDVSADRKLTQRWTGTAGYEFGYFTVKGEPDVTTHTPRVGLAYEITKTLVGSVNAAPQFVSRGGERSVEPFVRAELVQSLEWGSASVGYDRRVRALGAFGQAESTDVLRGHVSVTRWLRELTLALDVSYTRSEHTANAGQASALNVGIQGSYQLVRWLSLVAAYSVLRQLTDRDTSGVPEVDQNRLLLGLQFAYPIRF